MELSLAFPLEAPQIHRDATCSPTMLKERSRRVRLMSCYQDNARAETHFLDIADGNKRGFEAYIYEMTIRMDALHKRSGAVRYSFDPGQKFISACSISPRGIGNFRP